MRPRRCIVTSPAATRSGSTPSPSHEVKNAVAIHKPDFVFVDGDHTLRGALADHLMVREHARIIVHHDIHSEACPDTTLLWQALEKLERDNFELSAFVEQYPSVGGAFLGIGVMKYKMRLPQSKSEGT